MQNTAESRIPIPRAVRPSFLPKLRANKLASGHRRSAIISGYPHVNIYENDNTTPKVKTIKRAASTPAAEGKNPLPTSSSTKIPSGTFFSRFDSYSDSKFC